VRCAQALQAGAPDQVHQHRFGIVIGGVGGGDFAGKGTEKRIPCLPGGGFQSLFAGDDGAGPHMEGNAVATAEILDELLVPVRFCSPEMVVEMGGGQPQVPFFF